MDKDLQNFLQERTKEIHRFTEVFSPNQIFTSCKDFGGRHLAYFIVEPLHVLWMVVVRRHAVREYLSAIDYSKPSKPHLVADIQGNLGLLFSPNDVTHIFGIKRSNKDLLDVCGERMRSRLLFISETSVEIEKLIRAKGKTKPEIPIRTHKVSGKYNRQSDRINDLMDIAWPG